jgi:hypothetical protein
MNARLMPFGRARPADAVRTGPQAGSQAGFLKGTGLIQIQIGTAAFNFLPSAVIPQKNLPLTWIFRWAGGFNLQTIANISF